mmetsp:Transcript_9393/g.19220  ORF Transcript_9393/g.19220 Transcript_9393/m.19220 type:complete len:128 (-) Transcript_9393:533-916(-)
MASSPRARLHTPRGTHEPPLPVAVVTGASRGLGRALVGALLRHGSFFVVAAMRDPEKDVRGGLAVMESSVGEIGKGRRIGAVKRPTQVRLMGLTSLHVSLLFGSRPQVVKTFGRGRRTGKSCFDWPS